jgi:hypothetical protein
MATRKRRVPLAVREQLERKHRLASTMAERQGAALGRDARQQLRPLLKASTARRGVQTIEELTFGFSATAEAARAAFAQMSQAFTMQMPAWPTLSFNVSPNGRATLIPSPPVDTARLAALRTAEPYKVVRPIEVSRVIPDMVTCITAWRAWDVRGEGADVRLEALGKDHVWKPRRMMEAECDKGAAYRAMFGYLPAHDAPEADCTCGVWAFKELDGLVSALQKYSRVRVLGTVQLWGKVVETENGYRAEKAYPSELWLFDESLEELGFIYDVPVRMVK